MTIAAKHNGGLSQINLNFLVGSGDFPFLNLFKTGGGWLRTDGAGPPNPDTLDSDGYPTTVAASAIRQRILIPTQAARPGNYVLKWDGNGTTTLFFNNVVLPTVTATASVTSNVLTAGAPSGGSIQKGMTLSTGGRVGDQITGSAGLAGTYNVIGGTNAGSQTITFSGGSVTSAGGTGRYVFSTNSSVHIIGISAVGTPKITNMVFCHVDDEASLEAGNVFGVQFKAKLTEANFGVVRYLNWMNTNTSNLVNWADRRPITYYSYGGYHFRANLYCTSVAALSGSTFSVAAPSGWAGLVDKAQVIVKFDTGTTSANYTLNVGSTGAKTILEAAAVPLGTNYPIAINTFATCTYDITLDAWIKHGGEIHADFDVPGINNGVPPELLLQLCAEIGAHPWFTCPAYSLDPVPTDSFTKGLAQYVAANQPSWMIPRWEPVNEIWNSGGGFFFTTYATAKAKVYWGGTFTFQDWYGKAASVMGQIVSTAYSADRTRYQMIFGVQTATGQSSGATTANTDRIASTQYVAQAAAAQSPYTKSAASNWMTHLCAACYWTPVLQGSTWEGIVVNEYATADAAKKKLLIDTFVQSSLDPGNSSFYTLPFVLFCLSNLKTWVKTYGITKMTLYEGSFDPVVGFSNGSGNPTNIFRNDSIQSEYVYGLTLAMYNGILGLTDSTFTVEYPSMFAFTQSAEPTSFIQEWALLTDIYQPNTPQYNAIKAFNSPARGRALRMRNS